MELPDELKGKSETELEEWFLEALEADPVPVEVMIGLLSAELSAGHVERVTEWAELLQDAILEQRDEEAGLRLLGLRVRAWGDRTAAQAGFRDVLKKVCQSRSARAFAESCGLDDGIPATESLRRMNLLMHLTPKTLCHDSTWGFGVVRRVDDFYKKLTIDFQRKKGHQMAFSYAAEALEMIGADHLFAVKHNTPEVVDDLVANNPAEIVRMALRSYGPMSVPDVQDLLVPEILPEARWKAFWDKARPVLKKDPLVDMPSKRTEPLQLRDSAQDYGENWFGELAAVRDPKTIYELIVEHEREVGTEVDHPESMAILRDRFAYSLRATEGHDLELFGRFLVLASRFPSVTDGLDLAPFLDQLRDTNVLIGTSAAVPARDLPTLLLLVRRHDEEAFFTTMLEHLSENPVGVIDAFFEETGGSEWRERTLARMDGMVKDRSASAALIAWLWKSFDMLQEYDVFQTSELLAEGIHILESDLAGFELKAQNLMMTVLARPEWLEQTLKTLDDRQRKIFLLQVYKSHGWDSNERRSAMGRIIKLYPALAEVMTSAEKPRGEKAPASRFTSWRSYKERQSQLRKVVEEDIPKNSEEIAVARSYGDLRENFEYQAAKDHQRILMQRQRELEEDLRVVRGSDFLGLPSERAGMGTTVILERPDGKQETYVVLGEWDRDESLGIISNKSALAQALEGCEAGADVDVPSAGGTVSGTESCRIVEVGPLSDEVKAWIGRK